jgi:hypothetical protein
MRLALLQQRIDSGWHLDLAGILATTYEDEQVQGGLSHRRLETHQNRNRRKPSCHRRGVFRDTCLHAPRATHFSICFAAKRQVQHFFASSLVMQLLIMLMSFPAGAINRLCYL